MVRGHRRLAQLALLVLLLGTAPTAGAGQSPADPDPARAAVAGPGEVYLALGDSVAAGIGASRPQERGYPAILGGYLDRLTGRPMQRLNLAVPGETTAELLAGDQLTTALGSLDAARRDGLRVSPITVTIGANDLLRADRPRGAPDPTARAAALRGVGLNLRSLLARLRAATTDAAGRPTADVVVTGYYDPTGTPTDLTGTDGWWLARLDDTIAREARRAGARWVDVAAEYRGREAELTWYPSDIHPTNAGHRVIADAIWRALGYDATPPEVRIERPAAGPLDRRIPTVAAVVSDQVGVTAVELRVDGAPVGELPYVPEVGAYAGLWDARGATPGPHTLTVTAVDAAGNEATASVTVEVPRSGATGPPLATPIP